MLRTQAPPPADAGHAEALAYVGRADSIEQRIVARESQLPFLALPAAALRGRGPVGTLRGMATIGQGVASARRLLQQRRPAAILGTGGYVCVPLFLAAKSLGIPTMIYLPDVVPGLAVRFLAKIATAVASNVEDSAPYLRLPIYDVRWWGEETAENRLGDATETMIVPPKKSLIVTGYPVRRAIFEQRASECRRAFGLNNDHPTILVYGGSLGARSINRAIAALLPQMIERCQIIHICGREGDEQWLREAANRLPSSHQARYRLFPYLESDGATTMAQAFRAADLAICRSGASTLAELPAAGLPAVLVPYPYVHQEENADYLVRYEAAIKIADDVLLNPDDLPTSGLWQAVAPLLDNPQRLKHMAERSRQLARPAATRHLAAVLIGLTTRSQS